MEVNNIKGLNNIKISHAQPIREVRFAANLGVPTDSLSLNKAAQPPEIGYWRTLFSRLTDDQIKQVNKSRMLPQNAKFVRSAETSKYYIRPQGFGITTGTKQLPVGYELKKDIFGFTAVVAEGSEGMFIREAK